ncbi:MAG: nucleoside deaminase [Acidobacteria bacterium]|nr:nucleoside deaminase [Acidobacteriota bacterium]
MNERDQRFMSEALRLAEIAAVADEVPVGAVVVRGETIMGLGSNANIGQSDPTAHAEILALREAGRYDNNYRLPGAELFVTLEPCPMCYAALVQARISRLVYGANDPKGGYTLFYGESGLAQFNHQIEVVSGTMEATCRSVMQAFFKAKRERGKRKWLKGTL